VDVLNTLKRLARPWVLVTAGAVICLVVVVVVVVTTTRNGATGAASRAGTAKPAVAHETTTTSTVPPSTTTTLPGLAQPPEVVLPPLPGGSIGPGSSGPEVQAVQQRLVDVHFDPGPVDGRYGGSMAYSVQALQKILGTPRTGRLTQDEANALAVFKYPAPLQPDGGGNRTEIDVTKQVLTLYENHQVRLITTTSTGSGERYCYNTPRVNPTRHVCEDANTPSGSFKFREFRAGWDKSPLGQLYNPYYFNGGIAVHGYESVPPSPASHGCARIPMHIAEYFHTLVHNGDPVYVFGGKPANVVSSTPIAAAPPTSAPTAPVAPPVTPTAPPVTTPPTTAPPVTTTTTTAPPP
jgi:peptidoglycan hydrolase-like protein with peptidoglycan-binding domain